MLQASPLTRSFAYLSLKLPDPDSKLTVEEVRQFYSTQFPDLATASITGPEVVGDRLVYSFTRHIEILGAFAFSRVSCLKPFPFEISLFPRPAGKWRHRYAFVELDM